MSSGEIIIASSEFRARFGKIDGLIVYLDGIKYKESNIKLSQEEVHQLVERYNEYKLLHDDIIDWVE